jgi:transposase
MGERRKFSAAFKRQAVEELLSGVTTLAQLSRRLDISSGLILHWKKRYEEGGLAEGPSRTEKEFLSRISQLEQMVGRLTMENDLLKKAVEYTARRRKENSSPITAKSLAASKGGAK